MKFKKLKEIKIKKPDIKGKIEFIKKEIENYKYLYG